MDPLYQLYLNMTPEGQRVPALANVTGPRLQDSIRQQRPDVWAAWQQQSAPASSRRPAQALREERRAPLDAGGFMRPAPSSASPFRQLAGAPFRGAAATWRQALATPGHPAAALFAPGTGLFRSPYMPGEPFAPVNIDRAVTQGLTAQGLTAPGRTAPVEAPDWEAILAAVAGMTDAGGPGVSVNRSLFQLAETPEEAAMLERELADIEARRAAGDVALRAGWGNVQAANAAAAEKARALRAERGDAAAGVWSQAAQQARELAAARAQAAGAFEGRAGIDVSPEAGVADWAGFMESQAPAERALAERQQEMLGQDLDWLAGMAGAQGEAYAADLRRQASVMSFERAREHNLRVQDRIAQERMTLAQMEMQAQATNAQLAQAGRTDPMQRFNDMVGMAAVMGSPDMLAQQLGVTPQQAQQMINNFLRGTTQTVLAANPPR